VSIINAGRNKIEDMKTGMFFKWSLNSFKRLIIKADQFLSKIVVCILDNSAAVVQETLCYMAYILRETEKLQKIGGFVTEQLSLQKKFCRHQIYSKIVLISKVPVSNYLGNVTYSQKWAKGRSMLCCLMLEIVTSIFFTNKIALNLFFLSHILWF
jgi:hypothetical protein